MLLHRRRRVKRERQAKRTGVGAPSRKKNEKGEGELVRGKRCGCKAVKKKRGGE